MLNYKTGGRCVLGIATVLLAGCLAKPKENTLSHGLPDGGYERISQDVIRASEATSDLTVVGQNSEGSSQNLQWLQTGQTDFALTQLDVASEAMKEGRIQAVATLAEEFIYIIVRNDSPVKTLTDLAEQRVAVGTNGSGIHYTSLRLFSSAQIPIVPVPISPKIAFQQLNKGAIDALVYVGPHRSSFLQTELSQGSVLRIVPIDQKLINYLVLRAPESYQAAKIASGIQRINPPVPPRDIPTLATATALVTTPDTD
ncbi:MAG: TAXI family TRAP transporter solute-binding subunit, partial [Cyanobacteria bacterium J06633_23]